MNEHEKHSLCKNLPHDLRIPFENIINKNNIFDFKYDVAIAVPFGKKCLIWFHSAAYPAVLFIYKENANRFDEVVPLYITPPSYGTIVYGTLISTHKTIVAVEDILYHNHQNISHYGYDKKVKILCSAVVGAISPTVLIRLCVMAKTYEDLIDHRRPPYRCRYIQYKNIAANKSYHTITSHPYLLNCAVGAAAKATPTPKPRIPSRQQHPPRKHAPTIFTIKATEKDDIYHLYDKKGIFVDVAHIPDYKTSVMMNSIFRNIRENRNLDLLEESDDEEEDGCDTDLTREQEMLCEYNTKFNKWKPLQLRNT